MCPPARDGCTRCRNGKVSTGACRELTVANAAPMQSAHPEVHSGSDEPRTASHMQPSSPALRDSILFELTVAEGWTATTLVSVSLPASSGGALSMSAEGVRVVRARQTKEPVISMVSHLTQWCRESSEAAKNYQASGRVTMKSVRK